MALYIYVSYRIGRTTGILIGVLILEDVPIIIIPLCYVEIKKILVK